MSVEFRPTIKNVTIANDKVKIVLEVDKRDVKQKLGDIAELEGKDITALLRQEAYAYRVPYNKTTNTAGIVYEVQPNGIVSMVEEEQLQLDIDEKPEEIEDVVFMVERDTIDDFIMACPVLEFPGKINPKSVISELRKDVSWTEIAKDNEMSESALIDELERAREHYAPYADKWAQKKEKEGFEFSRSQDQEKDLKESDDTDVAKSDTEVPESDNESAENDTKTEENEVAEEKSDVGKTESEEDNPF